MCVNDLIVAGAEPLFFLDYYATGKLNIDVAADVVSGIGDGCELSGCSLVGGETAEMPGMYEGDDYDLGGFCVGIVEKSKILDGSKVKSGDVLLGLASSGPHSNGYSLIRKVLEVSQADLEQDCGGTSLANALLEPTRIYVKSLLATLKKHPIHALAHITGGGFLENIPRVLPANTKAIIHESSWQFPEVFSWIQKAGNVEQTEMLRTFNCGVGMVICVPSDASADIIKTLEAEGEQVFTLGHIEDCESSTPLVEMRP